MEHSIEEEGNSDSEGSIADEDLKEPVTKLDEAFFKEPYTDETDLFRKYFKAIKKNRYLLTLIADVLTETEPCEINSKTLPNTANRPTKYPLPSLSDDPHTNLPGASKNIDLKTSSNKGRCLMANSNIKAGDAVVIEKAAVFPIVPNCACRTNFNNFCCHHCATVIFKFVPCDHCDICLFCNETCRDEAWRCYHQFECYGLQRHFWKDEFVYVGLRLVIASISHKLLGSIMDTNNIAELMQRFQLLCCLETHMRDLTYQQLNEVLHECARTLVYLIERTNFFDFFLQGTCKPYYTYMYIGGLLLRNSCVARCSSLQIPVRDFFGDVGNDVDYVASVVCTTASMINHCCEPNCIVIHNNDTVIIRAITAIKPGEELTIAYHPITSSMSYTLRHWHCQKYHFTCFCDLCLAGDVDVTFHDSLRCPECSGRVVADGKSLFCLDCVRNYEEKFFEKNRIRTEALFKKLKATSELQYALKALKSLEETYYEFNYRIYIGYQNIYKYLLNCEEHFFRACGLAIKSVRVHYEHHGDNSLEHAYIVYKTLMQVMLHKNFRNAKWNKNHKPMLTVFMQKIQESTKTLSFYYTPDRLDFLQEMTRVLHEILETIAQL